MTPETMHTRFGTLLATSTPAAARPRRALELWCCLLAACLWPGLAKAEPPVPDGVMLDAAGNQFAALYRSGTAPNPPRAVVLLHGRQSGPDDPGIIGPLRRMLAQRGWSSLSLSLPDPLAIPGGYRKETAARLAAGVAFLREKKVADIALIGRDTGAFAALGYVLEKPDSMVKAVVLIERPADDAIEGFSLPAEALAQTSLPILEIATDAGRGGPADIAAPANSSSQRLVFEDHHGDWEDAQDFIANRIHGWLTKVIARAGQQSPEAGRE